MDRPIFSTYSTDENRVSGSLMAVLERLSLTTLESLLSTAAEEELTLVRFRTQPTNPYGPGTPDGSIEASALLLFEVKIKPGGVDLQQLRRHLAWLSESHSASKRLFYVTPDGARPAALDELDRPEQVIWTSFTMLDDAITEVLAEPVDLVSERERFLLREMADMFRLEGLVGGFDTVVVAGRVSWPEYLEYGIYACQAERSFRDVPYFGFYVDKQIQRFLPRRLKWMPSVRFDEDTAARLRVSEDSLDRRVGEAIPTIVESTVRGPRETYGVMVLTRSDEPETLEIEPVPHREPGAWTQAQRYTSSELLREAPRNTSELADWEQVRGLR